MRTINWLVALLAVLCLSAVIAVGQAIDGNVVGTVVDATGAAIVGAEVSATNVATGVSSASKTNGSGEYRFDHLSVGTYRINVKAAGFKSLTEGVEVQLNMTSTRNLRLEPGAASETIEVSGTPPTIDTTTNQLQTTYDSKLLDNMGAVTTGSGVLNASLLQAGVGSTGGLGAGSGPSVGGQRPRENNFTIEGTDNNDKGVTGWIVTIPNDAVSNFTVIANQFSPEFGHSAGGQFNQVVISGTNAIHGRVYEYFQNRNLNAIDQTVANNTPPGETPKNPRYDNNRFGGQVGGPIIKNKLFYFVNFEYNPIGQAAVPSSPALAPTADGWNQILGIPGTSANNVNGFSKYATAPVASGDTVSVNDYVTTPGTPIAHSIPIGIVPIVAPAFSNYRTLVTSMDYNMSDRDQIRGRYIYNKYASLDTGAELAVFFTPLVIPSHLVTLAEFHQFSANIGNELRVGFNRNANDYTVAKGLTFPGLDAFPNLTIDELGNINVGPDPNAPQYAVQNTYQLQDNLSWVKGNHNLRFGLDLRKQIDPQLFIQRSRGDYEWASLDGFVNDFGPNSTNAAGFAQRSFGAVGYSGDDKMYGWYVNDIWKIRPNLSLNLGLRYEYLTVPFGWTQQALNKVADAPGLITFNSPQAPKKDFMPRIGFAYSPGNSGNTSIRGGFSMGYDVLYDNIGSLSRPPQIGSTVNCPDTAGVCHASGFLANGGIPPQQSSGITVLNQADARANTSSYLPEKVQYPYAESWSLGVQHVFKSYTAEVRYVGSRGIHLPTQNILNLVTYVTKANSLPTYLSAPTPAELDALPITLDGPGGLFDQSYNCVTTCLIGQNYLDAGFQSAITGFMPWGASTYHGLQTQVQRRLTNGLQLQGAWTWSHTIDNSTADFHSTDITPRRPQDFFNLRAERGNSLLDHAHRLTFQVSYDVPWFSHDSNWFKKNILGNYQFIPVYTWESGQWGTVQSAIDANLNGDAAPDRVVLNPAGVKGTGSDVTPLPNSAGYTVAYLADNPSAQYITAGYGAYATSSRSTLQTPPINNFDFAAAKHLSFGERLKLDFVASASNIFNHPQFVTGYINDVASLGVTGPSRDNFIANSTVFNQPRMNFSSSPRTMQLALKFSF
ncbi:MAG TPA: carboxypeptidase regulatory-like domain-containing protein [Candidatus Sulfotelmatobacter sp.]|nr:carboxypeptidase regulatory-like domain-containing protein [Candidatus Sulfotelmatobacter sp.]